MPLGENIKKKNVKNEDAGEPVQQEKGKASEKVVKKKQSESASGEQSVKYGQYCVFSVGKEEYAIPIDIVKEVVKYNEPAPIPQMPPYLLGMSNIRGNIYGVMDLGTFFQGSAADENKKYLLVIDHEIYKMAIQIPEVPDSLLVEDDMIEELNSATLKSVIGQKYLKGIIKKDKRMIILCDILGMISSEQFISINA